jgi:hypothetical protein
MGRTTGGAVAPGIGDPDELGAFTHDELNTAKIEGIGISHIDLEALSFEGIGDIVSHTRRFERDFTVERAMKARRIDSCQW